MNNISKGPFTLTERKSEITKIVDACIEHFCKRDGSKSLKSPRTFMFVFVQCETTITHTSVKPYSLFTDISFSLYCREILDPPLGVPTTKGSCRLQQCLSNSVTMRYILLLLQLSPHDAWMMLFSDVLFF